jgi:hypothetical protein
MRPVPKNRQQWRDFTKHFRTTDLHSLKPEDFKSASKVEPIQYGALRVIWTKKRLKPFDHAVFGGLELHSARAMLDRSDCWKRYLAGIENKEPPSSAMGPFSVALTTQRQADNIITAAARPKIDNMPRTRSQTAAAKAAAAAEAQKATTTASSTTTTMTTTTTTTAMAGRPTALSSGGSGGSSTFDSPGIVRAGPVWNPFVELGTPPPAGGATARLAPFALTMTPMTPASNVALGAPAFPDVDDESIVNKALVDLLQAITMVAHENSSVERSVQWSTRRAAFAVRSGGEPLYVAQVDGHLTKSAGQPAGKRWPSKIILEVKATLRADKHHIKYQESAQVAAWISEEHAPTFTTPSKADNESFRYGFFCSLFLATPCYRFLCLFSWLHLAIVFCVGLCLLSFFSIVQLC